MSRVRSSMVLLGICVVALLIGTLRVATDRPPLPTGSSYSTQPDGAQGLYDWAATVGASSTRLQDQLLPDGQTAATLLVLQPETMLGSTVQDAFDTVPRQVNSPKLYAWCTCRRCTRSTSAPCYTSRAA